MSRLHFLAEKNGTLEENVVSAVALLEEYYTQERGSLRVLYINGTMPHMLNNVVRKERDNLRFLLLADENFLHRFRYEKTSSLDDTLRLLEALQAKEDTVVVLEGLTHIAKSSVGDYGWLNSVLVLVIRTIRGRFRAGIVLDTGSSAMVRLLVGE